MKIKFENGRIINSGKSAEKITKELSLLSDVIKVSVDGNPLSMFDEASDEENYATELLVDETGLPKGTNRLEGVVEITVSSSGRVLYQTPKEDEKFEKYNILLRPLGATLQVRLVDDRQTKVTESGIVVATQTKERTRIAEVLAVGPGQYNPMSTSPETRYFPMDIKVGDLVYINAHASTNAQVFHLRKYENEPQSFVIHETDVWGIYRTYEEALLDGLVSKRDM